MAKSKGKKAAQKTSGGLKEEGQHEMTNSDQATQTANGNEEHGSSAAQSLPREEDDLVARPDADKVISTNRLDTQHENATSSQSADSTSLEVPSRDEILVEEEPAGLPSSDAAHATLLNPVDEALATLPEIPAPESAPQHAPAMVQKDSDSAEPGPLARVQVQGHSSSEINGSSRPEGDHSSPRDEDDEEEDEVDLELRVRELEEEIRALQVARSEDDVRNKANLARIRSVVKERMDSYEAELNNKQTLHQALMSEKTDLESTILVMRQELERALTDIEAIRADRDELRRSLSRSEGIHTGFSQDIMRKEVQLRESEEELQRAKRQLTQVQEQRLLEAKELQNAVFEERQIKEEASQELRLAKEEANEAKKASMRDKLAREESETALSNLQGVLEDFQSNKDLEHIQTVSELKGKLELCTRELAVFQSRAEAAENKLLSQSSELENARMQESELKEKTLLVGKLRHEAVIINEHLTEALRRLKRAASGETVDRQLVTNVLTSFLLTPRGDTKRFEMLSLLSSILSWNDEQKELVGLQRGTGAVGNVTEKRVIGGGLPTPGLKAGGYGALSPSKEVDETNESFSKLWVEFLLKESSSHSNHDLKSPTSPTPPLSSLKMGQRKTSDAAHGRKLSFGPKSPTPNS